MTAFVLRNVSDLSLFFHSRLQSPGDGGRFVSLDMFPPSKTWFSAFYSLYFYRLVPWIGGLHHDDQRQKGLAESVEKLLFTADSRGTARTGGFIGKYAKVFNRQFACMWLRSLTHRRIHRKVMRSFSSSFSSVFYQSHWVASLTVSYAFHEPERAFYKSTAGVLFVIAVLGLWGEEPSVLAEYLC